MFTNSQKLRLLIYIIIVIALFFSFPIVNQMINDRSKAIPEAPKNSRKLETLKVLASKETTLFSDRGSNVWMPIERNSQIKAESNLASFGNDSGLLVKTPDELVIGIKGNSKITISKANDGIITVTPSYGCFGLRSDKAAGSDVNITFLSGVKRIKVLPKSVFCKNKPYEELFESKVDEVFIDKDVNTAKQLKLKNIFPCRDVVEVDDQSGSTASVLLKFLAPLMTNKTVLVSTNPDFTDTIFTAKTFLTEAKTNPLGKGRYFWRVKNESDGEISEVCHFDVVYHGDINLNMPKNDDVVIDNSIEFSWNKISGANKYTVAISKDLKNAVPISGGDLLKTVHRMETETNSVKLDDPMQTLGPGSYYWSVETKTGKVSPYRRFFVYTGNDIVMESPKYEDVFKPSDKFFLISWNPLPMVKSYSVVISSNPSFVSSDYVNTTTQPFVYIESLKEGKYYLKVSAIFNNDAKIVTDVIPFNVLDIPEVVILDPAKGGSMDVSTEKKTKALWKPVDGATEYVLIVNEEQPIKMASDKTETNITVLLGGNRVQVEAYCGTGASKKLCAKSRAVEFLVNNIIDPPGAPIIKYPYSRKVFMGGQVSMEWSPPKGANGYKVEISKNKDFSDIKETEMKNAKFNLQLKKGMYYWRVYSYTEKTGSKIYSRPTETRLFIVK